MFYDVIIVGAGASGLTAAIAAARKGSRVLVIEQKDRAGKKITATGNGKCNYTNYVQLPECYRGDDSEFAMRVLTHFGVHDTVRFFEELGIVPKERDGYLYPNSEQAASMVLVLLMECKRLSVEFAYEEKADKISVLPGLPGSADNEQLFEVSTKPMAEGKKGDKYHAARVILAAGGCASPKLGSDGSGYRLVKSMGHSLIKPLPALVQLRSDEKYCKTLSGVRTTGRVVAYRDDTEIAREDGEIIFTDYGISGIPILQISRFAAKALDAGKRVFLNIDFIPGMSGSEITALLKKRISYGKEKTLEQMMVGLFNHKLSYIILKKAGLHTEKSCAAASDRDIERLTEQIKVFRMSITDTNSFDNAQVCAGGVPVTELDEETMESKLVNGLYITGELIDIDGTCGGYNLQWAWTTGYLAGNAAGSR